MRLIKTQGRGGVGVRDLYSPEIQRIWILKIVPSRTSKEKRGREMRSKEKRWRGKEANKVKRKWEPRKNEEGDKKGD